jgi:hypothetical protein
MWELIYEDTFGFGEDRDPPVVECSGDNDSEGFFRLWEALLNESITGPLEKPVPGFARFTLILIKPDGKRNDVRIDTEKYFNVLAAVRKEMNAESIKSISAMHLEFFLEGNEGEFWTSLLCGKTGKEGD